VSVNRLAKTCLRQGACREARGSITVKTAKRDAPEPALNERPYKLTDLPRVIEIFTVSVHVLGAAFYSREQIRAWAPLKPDVMWWHERLASLQTIVSERDGVVAGFAAYTKEGYLDFLHTHPNFARRGVATGLYRHVEDRLRLTKLSKVTTHSSLAARAFFDRQGFLVDAEENVECRGAYLRRFAMHKPLNCIPVTSD
jgi:putative acetyltransferase